MVVIAGSRTLIRRVADFNVTRDPVSGFRIPAYTEQNITGTLIERGGDLPPIAAGVAVVQDAVVFTEDAMNMLDQIKDGTNVFLVVDIQTRRDTDGVLVFRACHLKRLEVTGGA